MRLYSLLSILTTFRGSTSFLSVTEATADTPELLLVGRITFPVFPSSSTPVSGVCACAVCVCVCVLTNICGGKYQVTVRAYDAWGSIY